MATIFEQQPIPEDQSRLNGELVEWLKERQRSLQIVKSTTTRSGTVLDWVPLESQTDSGRIATPPPGPAIVESREESKARRVMLELDDPTLERGPEGTVPIVRPDLSKVTQTIGLGDYLTKRGGLRVNSRRARNRPADPDPAGYFHNIDSQDGNFFGWDGIFNVWDPVINIPGGGKGDDHSILQVWLQTEDGVQQSLEGGWTVDKGLNGDLLPHLFTYYTTNGYTKEGNNLGGYNRLHKGWVQYSGPTTTGRTVYPGIAILSISVFEGPQFELPMKFQLYREPGTQDFHWWVAAEGIWIGYYPASLFGAGGLATHVEWVGAGGEISSSLKNPEATQDQMGSGVQAAAGQGKAAYIRNLRNQTDMAGTMANNDGVAESDAAVPEGSDPYTIMIEAESRSDWESFVFVGGPTPPREVLSTWLVDNVPLPKGTWDGQYWSESQKSRASNDRFLVPPGLDTAIRLAVTGTPQDAGTISFDVAIDRPGSDKTCWKEVGNGSVVELGPALAALGLSIEQANERGFYIANVEDAQQPFQVVAELVG